MWTGGHSDFLMAFLGIYEIYSPLNRMLVIGTPCCFHNGEGIGPYFSSLLLSIPWQAGALPTIGAFIFTSQSTGSYPNEMADNVSNSKTCYSYLAHTFQSLIFWIENCMLASITLQLVLFICTLFILLFAFILKSILPEWVQILRRHPLNFCLLLSRTQA